MPAIVTTKYLGHPEQEKNLCDQVEEFFKQYPGEWRVSILGAQQNTVWEMKVTAPHGRSEWVHKLYGEDGGHNIETILTEIGRIAEGLSTSSGDLSAVGDRVMPFDGKLGTVYHIDPVSAQTPGDQIIGVKFDDGSSRAGAAISARGNELQLSRMKTPSVNGHDGR